MRNLARAALCGLFTTTLAFTACGDDEKTTHTDTAAETTADTTAPDTTAPDTTAEVAEEVVAPTNQCTNTADLAVICSTDKDPAAKAGACGTSTACIGLALQGKIAEFETCTRDCMLDAARPNFTFVVSATCTDCYVASVACTAVQCLGSCASDPDSEACVTCRQEKGCTPSFFACAGDLTAACTAAQ